MAAVACVHDLVGMYATTLWVPAADVGGLQQVRNAACATVLC